VRAKDSVATIAVQGIESSASLSAPYNKALHQTRRQGVPASRAVVEGRLAGEGRCWTDRGTDRSAFVPPPPAVADAPSVLLLGNGPAWAALLRSFHQGRPSLDARPTILQHPIGQVSTWSLPSAPSWLGVNDETTDSGFPVVAPSWGAARPSNKGLERTRPAANGLTGPCRSTQCWAGEARERSCDDQ
jgi:hypothetical protein